MTSGDFIKQMNGSQLPKEKKHPQMQAMSPVVNISDKPVKTGHPLPGQN